MPKVDWSYHRKNCNSCSKTATFLEDRGIEIKTQLDARTTPLADAEALTLVNAANELYVTRGTKVLHFDLKKERPDDDSILALLIGRSGKLRAPAITVGKKLVVGFDQSTYETIFG